MIHATDFIYYARNLLWEENLDGHYGGPPGGTYNGGRQDRAGWITGEHGRSAPAAGGIPGGLAGLQVMGAPRPRVALKKQNIVWPPPAAKTKLNLGLEPKSHTGSSIPSQMGPGRNSV